MPAHTAARHRVLFVHSGGPWLAGSERSLLVLIDGLRERGAACSVLCNQPVFADACRDRGIPVGLYERNLFLLPSYRPQLNPVPFLRTVSEIRRFARRQGATVIHSNNVHPTQAAFVAARSLNLPIVAHIRGSGFLRSSRCASLIRWCDAVVSVSRGAAADYRPDRLGDRLHVVHTGIDMEPYVQADGQALRDLLVGDERHLVGTVAFLRPEKALGDFVRLAARARIAGERCRFVIAGHGPERPKLERLIAAQDLLDTVSLLGHVEDVPPLLRALDVFVLVSRADALPRALLQAAAAGVPAVATRVGGAPEIVEDGTTGYLVPAGNIEAMWEKVSMLLHAPALRASLGGAARRRVAEHFSLPAHIDKMLQVYESLP